MIFMRIPCIVALLACFIASPAWSVDPRRVDILTLRLGMTRADVLDRLAGQGYRPEGGSDSIRAQTKDGSLSIDFTSDGRSRRIVYKLNGRGPNETALLRAAMIDHYGTPTTDQPLTWCAAASPAGPCSPGQPLLSYGAGKEGGGVLTLSDRAEP